MKLFNSTTSFESIGKPTQKVESNCTSILFGNSSTISFDVNGNPNGWVMVINDVFKLLPGQNVSFNQNTGFVDNTIYNVSFSNELGGVGNKLGSVIRINTNPNCKC